MSITKISPSVVDFDAGITISTTDNTSNLILTSTDADANVGPVLELYRNSSSPADNDELARIYFYGENDNDEKIEYGLIRATIVDASDGDEGSLMQFLTYTGGGQKSRIELLEGETVFNEGSSDIDFRVESNDSANMLFVDGGNNKVLIEGQNTASVTDSSSMQAAGVLEVNGNAGEGSDHIKMGAMADGTGNQFIEATNSGATAAYDLLLQPINGGTVGIGTTNAYDTLHISRTSTTQTAGLTLENLQAGGYGSGITWESKRSDSSAVQTAARIYVAGLNNWASDANADSQFLFYVRSDNTLTEMGRIDGEAWRVARSAGAGATDYGADLYASGHLYLYVNASGNDDGFRLYNNAGTLKASIEADGDYIDHSDENYKENIADASSVLSTIADIKVRSFNWKEDDRKQSYGFVAQELKDVVPEATKVPEKEGDMWGVRNSRIVPMLTKAIQEQQTLIETLQTKVKALEEA
jgi:hypothetical protein